MKVEYLAPRNTFSELAAQALMPEAETIPVPSIDIVTKDVAEGKAERGVIAYYNQLEGLVQEGLDLIYEHGLHITDAHREYISFTAGKNGEVHKVYSQPKALAQCSDFLTKYYPEATRVSVGSTADGVHIAEQEGGLALARHDAILSSTLCIVEEDVGNKRNGRRNYTDFYLVSATPGVYSHHNHTMIAVTPPYDVVGLLHRIMGRIREQEINNSKIHSRPAIDHVEMKGEPQMFYLEMECMPTDTPFLTCVGSLQQDFGSVDSVRVMGSYGLPR